MAISTKKTNMVIASWKTGSFKSYTAIAKHFKISTKTAQKIIGDNAQDNADVVALGIEYEKAKKSTKNPHEIKAIEKVVDDATKHLEFFKQATLKNASVMMKKVDEKMPIHEHKAVQDTLDKGLISMGLAERHAPRAMNIQQQAQQQSKEEVDNKWTVELKEAT